MKMANVNIGRMKKLPTFNEIKKRIPLSRKASLLIKKSREAIENILTGRDKRKIIIAGPCSIHDTKEAIEFAKQNPNTPFATELRRRIQSGQMDRELTDAGLVTPKKESGFMAAVRDIPSDIRETFTGATEAVTRGIDSASNVRSQVESGEVSPIAGTLKTIGSGLRTGADVIGQGLVGTGKLFTSPATEQAVSSAVQSGVERVVESSPVQTLSARRPGRSAGQIRCRSCRRGGRGRRGHCHRCSRGSRSRGCRGRSGLRLAENADTDADTACDDVPNNEPVILPVTLSEPVTV
jgi:hypothetical protein